MFPTQSHLLGNSQFFSQIWQFYWSWVKIWIWSRHVWAGPLGSHDIAIWLWRFTWPRITSQNQSHSSEIPKHPIIIMIIPHHRWWMFRCEVDIRFANYFAICEVRRGGACCGATWSEWSSLLISGLALALWPVPTHSCVASIRPHMSQLRPSSDFKLCQNTNTHIQDNTALNPGDTGWDLSIIHNSVHWQ